MQNKFNFIISSIDEILKAKQHVIIAIDGPCGAGKTTLAQQLNETLHCNVIHIDDFFLQPSQRTPQRLATPGENVDHQRFLDEVLIPLSKNEAFQFRPFCCKTMDFGAPITVSPRAVTIVEGSYSCHPDLWGFYDLHIYVDVDKETQLKRIINRNGKIQAKVFKTRWIPLEEAYFDAFSIEKRCEIVY